MTLCLSLYCIQFVFVLDYYCCRSIFVLQSVLYSCIRISPVMYGYCLRMVMQLYSSCARSGVVLAVVFVLDYFCMLSYDVIRVVLVLVLFSYCISIVLVSHSCSMAFVCVFD